MQRQIGEGSFGKALLAKSRGSGRQYVIKQISLAKMNSRERADARREVMVLRELNHCNVVAMTSSFEERGKLYIVMECVALRLLTGGRLAGWRLRTRTSFPGSLFVLLPGSCASPQVL